MLLSKCSPLHQGRPMHPLPLIPPALPTINKTPPFYTHVALLLPLGRLGRAGSRYCQYPGTSIFSAAWQRTAELLGACTAVAHGIPRSYFWRRRSHLVLLNRAERDLWGLQGNIHDLLSGRNLVQGQHTGHMIQVCFHRPLPSSKKQSAQTRIRTLGLLL